ncbi:MAG TPA: DUF2975 domain-containing protein [Allosphingosinicella sp.]|jgi:hypothetical protein
MRENKLVHLRRQSRWLARLTILLLAATCLLMLLPTLLGLLRDDPSRLPVSRRLAAASVHWTPALFYLFALWAIGRAFAAFGRGGTFGPSVARGCTHAGVALALGAAASAVAVPNMLRLFVQRGLIEGPPRGYGSVLVFDMAYVAVGVVGIAFVLLGRLLERATEIEREAGELRAELGEFF